MPTLVQPLQDLLLNILTLHVFFDILNHLVFLLNTLTLRVFNLLIRSLL